MPLWLDRKFINLVSPKLSQFKWKKETLANFRCPFCGDSKKNKLKARGYFYPVGQSMFYRCHNCGEGRSIANFLKDLDHGLHAQYIFEAFNKDNVEAETTTTVTKSEEGLWLKPEIHPAFKLDKLPKDHPARAYIAKRKIPEKWLKVLEFTSNLQAFTLTNFGIIKYAPPKAFILIPIHDAAGKLVGYNSRALSVLKKGEPKYVKLKRDESSKMIFNIENVDKKKQIFVFEGEFNAMFVDNAIATGGVNSMFDVEKILGVDKSMLTLVVDKDRRNKEVLATLEKLIDAGYTVALIPGNIKGKDINDFVVKDKLDHDQIKELLDRNSFSGLRAKVELANWRISK